jgi:NAD(P)H-dependent FMN reductase
MRSCSSPRKYNYGFNAPLKNAIDYLHHEWKHKPVGFVSYGGVAAGTRAVQMFKQVITGVGLVAAGTSVSQFVQQFLDEERRIQPNEMVEDAPPGMLDELEGVEHALRELRVEVAQTA